MEWFIILVVCFSFVGAVTWMFVRDIQEDIVRIEAMNDKYHNQYRREAHIQKWINHFNQLV